ncbi:MAG: hypothetical protein AAFV95_13760 [Bacteroidota bacterium]
MKFTLEENIDIEALLAPETETEQQLLSIPAFRQGLLWGTPRYGHPEGKVVFHIREVLDNIDKLDIAPDIRSQLRLIAYAHDTFKYLEHKGTPRDWSRHHSILARTFMEKITEDSSVLDIIELHDEAYYSWRLLHLHKQADASQKRLDNLLNRLENNRQTYYLFFKCDTCTGDKNPAPLRWFEQTIDGLQIVQL